MGFSQKLIIFGVVCWTLGVLGSDNQREYTPSHCPGIRFQELSASEWSHNANPGWNLGNTLDAIPDEGSWNNPPVVPSIFTDIKKAGFKSIRLPVTWFNKIGPAPTYVIDDRWLTRVAAVINEITERDLYTIVNIHHDAGDWLDFSKTGSNITSIEEKFTAVWKQIAVKLQCTPNLVAFEPVNEARGSSKDHADVMNRLNKLFVDTVNQSGGFNAQRVLTLVGLGEDAVKTSKWFKKPEGNWRNPWALQYHYYSPYDFIFSAWGKTTWGSQSDVEAMDSDLMLLRQSFPNVPLIIGEWGVPAGSTESASRWRWIDSFIRTATKYNTTTFFWDNGEQFDRSSRKWQDATTLAVLMNAQKGNRNSLPVTFDEITNSTHGIQRTSAYIFSQHQVPFKEDKILQFNLNGNTVESIADSKGQKLLYQKDYRVEPAANPGQAESIRIHHDAIAKYVTNLTVGIKERLNINFSSGAPVEIDIVSWERPTLDTLHDISYAPAGKEFEIPITFKGLAKVAAVKAVYKDSGKPILDDWTQYLGPLQAGYLTFNTHWNYNSNKIILKKELIDLLNETKKQATLTFDFWPRVPENRVERNIVVYTGGRPLGQK